ncbi:MAG: PAS domain S-box protein [Candidatus Lokiarchaeota archaeon]|nr:PAS domain S-box protein [Candidatus Lokiarchaeota archaeon]
MLTEIKRGLTLTQEKDRDGVSSQSSPLDLVINLVQSQSDPIIVCSSKRIHYVNKALIELLNLSIPQEDIVGISQNRTIQSLFSNIFNNTSNIESNGTTSIYIDDREVRLGYSILTYSNSSNSTLHVVRIFHLDPSTRITSVEKIPTKSKEESERLHFFFRRIAQASMQSAGLKDFGNQILQFILDEFNFDIGSIRILDDNSLILVAHAGLTELELGRLSLSLNLSEDRFLPIQVIKRGKPLISEDLQRDERVRHHVDPFRRLNTRAHISWPIFGSDGEAIGLVNLGAHHPQSMTDEYLSMFKSVMAVFAITIEHQLSIQDVRSQEQRFEILFQESPLPAVILQIDGSKVNPLMVNQRAKNFLGLDTTDVHEKLLGDIFPFSIECILEDIQSLIAGTALVNRELEYELTNGSERIVKLHYSLITDDTTLLYLTDLTRQKNIEAELRETNSALVDERNMFISGKVVLYRSGPEMKGIPKYISQNIEAMFGYTVEEWMSGNISYLDIVHPEDIHRVRNHLLSSINDNKETIQHKPYRVYQKDGSIIWVDHHVVISYDDEGNVLNFTGYMIDVTDLQETQEALRLSERNYRSLSSNLPHGLVVIDGSNILYHNPQFEVMFRDILPDNFENNIDSFLSAFNSNTGLTLQDMIQQGEDSSKELQSSDYWIALSSNDMMWVNVIVSKISFEGIDAIQILISDISERKKIERSIETTNALLVSTIEAVSIGVLAIDTKGNILYINEFMKELWDIIDNEDLSAEELLDLSIDVIENTDILRDFFNMKECTGNRIERLCFSNGTVLEMTCSTLKREGQKFGRIIFFRDITDSELNRSIAEAMSDLGLMLGGTHELGDTFTIFLKTAISVSNMDFGALYVYNQDTDELDITCFQGFDSDKVSRIRYFPFESHMSKLIRKKEVRYMKFHESNLAEFNIHPKKVPLSIAAIPLTFNDQLVAALIAGSYSEYDIPKRSRLALENIGHQIASAMARVKFETTLRVNEERYRAILQSLNDIVVIVDEEERVSDFYISENSQWHSRIIEVLGQKLDEVMDEPLYDQLISLVKKTQVTQEANTTEIQFESDNQVYYFSVNATPHQDGNSVVLVGRDLTESRRAIEQQKVQQIELELFASILRHDLGNELQNLMHYLEIISLDSAAAGITIESSEVALNLVDRMGKVIRLFSEGEDKAEDHILDLLNNISEQAMKTFPELSIDIECPDSFQRTRVISGRLLSMCFMNLFRNSVQHSDGPVEINIQIQQRNGDILIQMKDNGPGIDPSIKDKLFQKGISTKGGGMGLYLTRQVLKAYGGSIELIDADSGAIFEIRLPILT